MKYIYLQTIIFLLCSCQHEIIDKNEESVKHSTTFSYVKIEYLFDYNTQFKETTMEYPTITINNNTKIKQAYIDTPQKHFFEKSNFWSSDTRAFSNIEDQLLVKTPTDKASESSFTYNEETQWLYSKQEQKRRPIAEFSKTIYIKPKHRLSIIPCVTFKEIMTTYKIYFIGNEEGETLTITGQWSGVMFISYNADYIEEPII